MDFNKDEEEKAPYMGKIHWSRCTSNGRSLFGTDIKPFTTIQLRISTASQRRDLSKTWIHEDKVLTEVEMSPLQWAEFLTAGNTEGVPCTLRFANGEYMPEVPFDPQIKKFNGEIKKDIDNFKESFTKIIDSLDEMLNSGKPIGKKQVQELRRQAEIYKQNTVSNLKFVENSFKESLEDLVVRAKAEVNAFVEQKVIETGLQNLKNFEGINKVDPLKIEDKKEE